MLVLLACLALTVLTVHGCWAASAIATRTQPSLLLHPPAFLSLSATQCKPMHLLPGLFSHPLRRGEERGLGYYPEFLISQTGCILQQASLKIFEIITVVYFIHTHIRTHAHTYIYDFIYIYIFFSLPLQLRDAPGIYLYNEKREIGRSKGIFL